MELSKRLRVIAARPGPGADLREALGVDLDDRHLAGRRAIKQLRSNARQAMVERLESAADEQDHGCRQRQQDRGEARRPVAAAGRRPNLPLASAAHHRAALSDAQLKRGKPSWLADFNYVR